MAHVMRFKFCFVFVPHLCLRNIIEVVLVQKRYTAYYSLNAQESKKILAYLSLMMKAFQCEGICML